MTTELESTGYANGARFTSESQVREYFTADTMREMFGDCEIPTDAELREMADKVIAERLHCNYE